MKWQIFNEANDYNTEFFNKFKKNLYYADLELNFEGIDEMRNLCDKYKYTFLGDYGNCGTYSIPIYNQFKNKNETEY